MNVLLGVRHHWKLHTYLGACAHFHKDFVAKPLEMFIYSTSPAAESLAQLYMPRTRADVF